MGIIKDIYRNLIQKLLEECINFYKNRLISFCVYGSAGRKTIGPESDIDFLIIAEPFPDGRLKRVEEFRHIERSLIEIINNIRKNGIFVELSPVFKTPYEVQQGSPLFLDMIDDGEILFDRDNYFKEYLNEFKKRLQTQGAHRVCRGDSWYWILKEPYVFGEEIKL